MKLCPICKVDISSRKGSRHFTDLDGDHKRWLVKSICQVIKLYRKSVGGWAIIERLRLPFTQAWISLQLHKLHLGGRKGDKTINLRVLYPKILKLVNRDKDARVRRIISTKLERYNHAFGPKANWSKGLTKDTDSRIALMSRKLKGRVAWSKGLVGDPRVVAAHKKSEATNIIRYGSSVGNWRRIGQAGSERAKEAGRKGAETRLRLYGSAWGPYIKCDTLPEREIESLLVSNGYTVLLWKRKNRHQHKFNALPVGFRVLKQCPVAHYLVDFYFPDTKTVLFVDGCYWHGHNCELNRYRVKMLPQQTVRIKIDTAQTLLLEARGYTVLHVWECSIQQYDFSDVATLFPHL